MLVTENSEGKDFEIWIQTFFFLLFFFSFFFPETTFYKSWKKKRDKKTNKLQLFKCQMYKTPSNNILAITSSAQ